VAKSTVKPGVVVIDADRERCRQICDLLTRQSYRASPLYSLDNLEEHLGRHSSKVVILDLDTVPADNQFFRTFKRKNQDVQVLVASSLSYHPGLEEAIGSHIYACLAKPLDQEELLYWLRSISESLPNPKGRSPEFKQTKFEGNGHGF
jgi:DNA-binding NtrC family response regulator